MVFTKRYKKHLQNLHPFADIAYRKQIIFYICIFIKMSSSKSQSNDLSNNDKEGDEKLKLRLKNIHKEYSSQDNGNQLLLNHVILNNLNLTIKEGEFVTIVGPSGCGKSTLLNILAGMDTYYNGEIYIDSKPIKESANTDRVVVFQEGALFPWLTVYQNIEFGLKIAKIAKENRRKTVCIL